MVVVVHMVAFYCRCLLLVIVGVVIDLRVVVPVSFRHSGVIAVVIDSCGLVVLVVVLSVHLVRCNGNRLTVLNVVCVC